MSSRVAYQTRRVPGVVRDIDPDQHYRVLMPVEESAIRRLAHLIKTTRESLGWTQDKLAEVSGVSRPTIQRYENVKTPNPEGPLVRQLFLALGINPLEAPVIFGLVTREEIGLPAEPVRRHTPSVEEAIRILEDPDVPDETKREWMEFLRFRAGRKGDAGRSRKVG